MLQGKAKASEGYDGFVAIVSLGEVVQITAMAQMEWKLAIGGECGGADRE